MPLIDQRILIAAPAEAIWTFLVSPPLMVKWHRGCKQVSILSTRVTGVGSRRRITDNRGETTVEEITHWLDNLGYEYSMIDGPYRSYKGRFRLQPIPEGTIVNWIIEYQLRGPLAGVRGVLGARRRVEGMMADSLRQLRKLVEKSGVRIDPQKQARFAMRAAPSVEDRAMARVVEAPVPGAPGAPDEKAPVAAGATPIIVDEDSEQLPPAAPSPRKAPPIVAVARPEPPPTPDAATPEPGDEPSFVEGIVTGGPDAAALPDDHPSLADTKPRPPAGLREAIAAQMGASAGAPPESAELPAPAAPESRAPAPSAEPDAGASADEPVQLWKPDALTVPVSLVAPPPPPRDEMPTQTMDITPPSVPDTLPESVPTPRSILLPKHLQPPDKDNSAEAEPILPPPTHTGDTGEISIWDAFGVVPPSERAKTDLEAIIASLQTPPEGTPAQPPPGASAGAKSARRVARHIRRRARPDRPPVRPVARHTRRARPRRRR
ncbi:MAG: SRPBCC family protein [Anaerolineae bacterium]|nr:SRPBCC family protein [Anaerolineae bacterium]